MSMSVGRAKFGMIDNHHLVLAMFYKLPPNISVAHTPKLSMTHTKAVKLITYCADSVCSLS